MRRSTFLRAGAGALAALAAGRSLAAAPARVLHVMSYRSDWAWNQEQLGGFKEGLGLADAEFRIVELDAKRNDPAHLKSAVQKAHELVEAWKPDLVYTNDDVAQSEFSLRHLGGRTPIVYSGVNKEHRDYGFDKAGNVTGVLEREHFLGTLSLLREIKPHPKLRIALVFDDDPTWVGVGGRIRAELAQRSDVEVVSWLQPRTFDDYKSQITALQGKVDALGLLGIFRFAKADGKFADYEEVQRWTVDHSTLPDFSFWDTRVERGTLCAMTVSGIEQGRLAGRMARRILVDRVAPSAIEPQATAKGRPMISMARARKLGLKIDANVLLAAEVLPKFAWER